MLIGSPPYLLVRPSSGRTKRITRMDHPPKTASRGFYRRCAVYVGNGFYPHLLVSGPLSLGHLRLSSTN